MYAATINNVAPERIYKWTDPVNNLAGYTRTNIGAAGGASRVFVNSMVYDSTNNAIYICYAAPASVGGFYTISISKIDPSTIAETHLYDIQLESTAGFAPFLNSSICTDGVHIWTISDNTDQNSTVYQHTVAGVAVNSLQMPNPAVGTNPCAQKGSVILFGGDGFLYVAGSKGNTGTPLNGWAGRVDTALTTATTIQTPGLQSTCDDAALIGTNFWLGSEVVANPGLMMKVAKDMSSATQVLLNNSSGWVDGMWYDGTFLWIIQVNDPNPGTICKLNPATSTVISTVTTPPAALFVNEIILLAGNTVAYVNTDETNSHVFTQAVS